MNRKTTPALPIHVTPHHLTLSPSLYEFVRTKLTKVLRFAADASLADIVLRRHHGTEGGKRFSASARIALPGHDIHARASHADLYTAVLELVGKLARRSRKRNTRRARAERESFPSALPEFGGTT